jgi:hypothetical protein
LPLKNFAEELKNWNGILYLWCLDGNWVKKIEIYLKKLVWRMWHEGSLWT